MGLLEELLIRLRELFTLEASFRPYLRTWRARVSDTTLQELLTEIDAAIGPETDRLARSLSLLGDRPQLGEESVLLFALQQQDPVLTRGSPVNVDIHCVVSLLGLASLRDSLYQSAIFMSEAARRPEVERGLREGLARLQHETAHLQELLFLLLAQSTFEVREEAA